MYRSIEQALVGREIARHKERLQRRLDKQGPHKDRSEGPTGKFPGLPVGQFASGQLQLLIVVHIQNTEKP